MNSKIEFYKYQGTGNDFIMIDGRDNKYSELTQERIAHLCHRRFGIGADGLIILKRKDNFDFEMDYYNADGNRGSMCGNGGRCTIAFAFDLGIIKSETHFFAPDGPHDGIFIDHNTIRLKMQDVTNIEEHELGLFMDTGSPHLIIFKNNNNFDTFTEGKNIRYNSRYNKKGVNVNFVITNNNFINVYTYERGVEDATYSCGTGTVASAIASNLLNNFESPVKAETLGGTLTVDFKKDDNNNFYDIWLQGFGVKVFHGSITF